MEKVTRPVRLLRTERLERKKTIINTLSALRASLPTPKESLRERARIIYRNGFADAAKPASPVRQASHHKSNTLLVGFFSRSKRDQNDEVRVGKYKLTHRTIQRTSYGIQLVQEPIIIRHAECNEASHDKSNTLLVRFFSRSKRDQNDKIAGSMPLYKEEAKASFQSPISRLQIPQQIIKDDKNNDGDQATSAQFLCSPACY